MKKRMMRETIVLTIILLMVSLLLSCDPSFTIGKRDSEPNKEVFVIHGLGQTIAYYDIDEEKFHSESSNGESFLVGSSPNQLVIDKDKNLLYCINSLDNSITYFSLSTLEWIDEVYLGVGINPWNMSMNSDNSSIAYISGWISNEIIIFDLIEKEILKRVSLAQYGNRPQGIIYHDGYLYTSYVSYSSGSFGNGGVVVHQVDSNDLVFVEDIKTGSGSNPQSMFVDEDTPSLHVICTGVNDEDFAISNDGKVEIYTINSDGSLTYTTTLSIEGSPLFSPSAIDEINNIVYLANTGGYITSYNKNSNMVVNSATTPLYKDDEVNLFSSVAYFDDTLMASAFNNDYLVLLDTDGVELMRIPSGDGPQFLIRKER